MFAQRWYPNGKNTLAVVQIPQLLTYFAQKFAKQMQNKIEGIAPAVVRGLTAWAWPGNIRELENFTEHAVIITPGKSLRISTT